MDELGLAESLEPEHLVIGLQGFVADLVGLALCKLADNLPSLVHSSILVEVVQVNLRIAPSTVGKPAQVLPG